MGRRMKQLIYGVGFLLVFAGIIWGVYVAVIRPEPTCFDGRQNSKETGIDCGGPCEPCEQKYATSVRVGYIGIFKAGERTVAIAELQNPNDEYGFRELRYTMTAVDASGASVGSTSGSTFLYDKNTKGTRYILETIDTKGVFVTDVRVDLSPAVSISRRDFMEPRVALQRSTTEIVGVKSVTEPIYVFTRTLNETTIGEDVRRLEEFLYQKQLFAKLPDGMFDADTRNALIAYQKARSIAPANGVFGPLTRTRINAEMDRVTKKVVEPNASVAISGSIKNNYEQERS